ncbi:ribosomal protein S4 [Candidatus Carsonella ruddii PV]|uniref:Small ribosomal subunit protein uS4 n=1 Tax=Carsonella ruddii (strain PV) TaxID=387662 RepID=RS4_CARRP|nr:30S ribosomal protein S4 [Candidatus Carsonella ruddii]Q05FK4.1 RecName: Full=Small ribosomal subunit protein uS4; AltName: Full=30S ribosomal protein S4 [Candidatus Carsonella ruddii PV]BAF35167.1 ribosomal protein S4 [Candidatus Carsonella ruddii PV]
MTKKKSKNIKFCRREGENLEFFSEKKYLEKSRSNLTPGENGTEKGKVSDFGLILRTKQKIKRYYCIFEKEFKKIYFIIKKNFFNNIDLINFLERRLDNVIYRFNFSISRKESRQLIIHGNVFVNYFKNKIPSYLLSPGDVITINKKFLLKKYLYDYKNILFVNWLYNKYFDGYGIFLSFSNKNLFNLNKNLILDIYK